MKFFLITILQILQIQSLLHNNSLSLQQRRQFLKLVNYSRKHIHNLEELRYRESLYLKSVHEVNELNAHTTTVKFATNRFSVMNDEEKNLILDNNREKLRKQKDEQASPRSLINDHLKNLTQINKSQNNKKRSSSGASTAEEFSLYWFEEIDAFFEEFQTTFMSNFDSYIQECSNSNNDSQLKKCIQKNKKKLQKDSIQFNRDYRKLQKDIQNDYKQLKKSIDGLKKSYKDLNKDFKNQRKTLWKTVKNSIKDFQSSVDQNNQAGANTITSNLFEIMIQQNKGSRDWISEGKVTAVRDQQQCGSCWVFSATAVIESQIKLNDNGVSDIDLAEQQPLNCTYEDQTDQQGRPRDGCEGGLGFQAIQSIINTGIQLESDLPYVAQDNTCANPDGDDTVYNVASYHSLDQSGNMQLFLEALYERPLAIAFHVSNAFLNYSSGIIDCTETQFYKKNSWNNHEVLATGYYIDQENPENSYIQFKNQWGEDWGENGYFRMKLFNELTSGNRKQLENSTASSVQQRLYLNNGPCGLLSYYLDTVWVTMS